MNNNKMYELADLFTDKTIEAYDRLVDRLCKIHEQNREIIAKAVAFVLVKTVLKKYMYNMQMYEIKHGEEDIGQR